MNTIRKCPVLVIAFLFGITMRQAIQAQENDQNFVPTWDVLIAGQRAIDFDSQDIRIQQLSFNTLIIFDRLIKEVKTRRLSSEEILTIKQLLKEKSVSKLKEDLQQKLVELDAARIANQTVSRRLTIHKDIRSIKKDMRFLNSLTLSEIPLDLDVPVKLKEATGSLDVDSLDSLDNLALEEKVFQIIYYQLEALDDEYVAVDIYSYNAILKKEELVTSTVFPYNSFESQEDKIDVFITDAVSGIETGTLKVDVHDANGEVLQEAAIYIDGELLGFGTQRSFFVSSGTFLLSVEYKNQRKEEILEVSSEEVLTKIVRFDVSAQEQITIVTVPSQAKVYRDSQYIGLTPISLEKPFFGESQLELIKQDYNDARLTINSSSGIFSSVTLLPMQADTRADRLKTQRNQFYTSFAIFGVSFLLPVFLNGFLRNTENAYAARGDALSTQEQINTTNTIQALEYSYYGSVGITIGVGVWAIVELFQYLRTAREYQDR